MHPQIDKSIFKNNKGMVPQKTNLKVAVTMLQRSMSWKKLHIQL